MDALYRHTAQSHLGTNRKRRNTDDEIAAAPCALQSCVVSAQPHRSSSAQHSSHTGPSSWCIRHCGARPPYCTPHQSASPSRHAASGSHTFPPRYCEQKHKRLWNKTLARICVTVYHACGNSLCVPGKLMLAEPQNISSDFRHNLALVLSAAVLQNVLNYIIPILILYGDGGKKNILKRNG